MGVFSKWKHKKIGTSKSGAPIIDYKEAGKRDLEFSPGDAENIGVIDEHIKKYIGEPETVFHEIISDLVHIDVHVVPPSSKRNYYTLVTSGMSERPMNAPPEVKKYSYTELILCLPPTWKMSEKDFKDEKNYWPVRLLKFLAYFPHHANTWISYGHTIPNGPDAAPFAENTKLGCAYLSFPVLFDKKFIELKAGPEKTIYFYSVIPLSKDEMEFKLDNGSTKLEEMFEEKGVTELLNPVRPSVLS